MSFFDDLFKNIYGEIGTFSMSQFLMSIGCALLVGLIIAGVYMFRNKRYTSTFLVTIALLPAIVTAVVLVVGNNIGAGIAIAGAFSLVKFRSAPGTAKEIAFIFMTMCAGLLIGAGYLGYSVLFTAIICAIYCLYNHLNIKRGNVKLKKTLRITIPEDLEYTGLFDDIFDRYTESHDLTNVKTTNMGTMFRLTYTIVMKGSISEKSMIDDIRCRNGNLEIQLFDNYSRYMEL